MFSNKFKSIVHSVRKFVNTIRRLDSTPKSYRSSEKVTISQNESVIDFLQKYPHMTTAKNFKVVELIEENEQLRKMFWEVCEYNEDIFYYILSKHGYKMTSEGYLIQKGEDDHVPKEKT